jgi:hypothetical protein
MSRCDTSADTLRLAAVQVERARVLLHEWASDPKTSLETRGRIQEVVGVLSENDLAAKLRGVVEAKR